jgi:prevent-host-death family protein
MTHMAVPLREARGRFGELVEHAQHEDPVVLTKHGKPVAAIVPIDLLEAFERFEEERIARLIDERRNSPTVSYDEVLDETLARPE